MRRPTKADLAARVDELTEELHAYWLDGFAAGRRSNQDNADAANALALRTWRRNRVLAAQIRALSDEVFIRGHDGYRPLGEQGR